MDLLYYSFSFCANVYNLKKKQKASFLINKFALILRVRRHNQEKCVLHFQKTIFGSTSIAVTICYRVEYVVIMCCRVEHEVKWNKWAKLISTIAY